jgi:hypothetical protein
MGIFDFRSWTGATTTAVISPLNCGSSFLISSRLNTTGNRWGLSAGTASKNPNSR